MWKLMCCFLLSAIQVLSEKIKVDQDSNAVLFNNATADNRENEVSLYINGESIPTRIVKWTFENGDIKTTWSMHNYSKLYMDANRNIMIANIDKNYEGKYRLQSSKIRAVDLTVLTINNSTVMQTTVKDVKEANNNSTIMPTTVKDVKKETSHHITKVLEGTEGTCIYNPVTIAILVIVVFIAVVIVVYIFWKYACCQCKKNPCYKCKKIPCNQCKKKNISREQTKPLMKIHDKLWKKHFDKLSWEDVRQLLNGDQQQGLQTYIDSEHKTEDASTEDPTCTGAAENIPLVPVIEPRDDYLCKICFANTSGVSFLPCGHMATCINCSNSVQECPVCRTKIMAQIKPFSISDS